MGLLHRLREEQLQEQQSTGPDRFGTGARHDLAPPRASAVAASPSGGGDSRCAEQLLRAGRAGSMPTPSGQAWSGAGGSREASPQPRQPAAGVAASAAGSLEGRVLGGGQQGTGGSSGLETHVDGRGEQLQLAGRPSDNEDEEAGGAARQEVVMVLRGSLTITTTTASPSPRSPGRHDAPSSAAWAAADRGLLPASSPSAAVGGAGSQGAMWVGARQASIQRVAADPAPPAYQVGPSSGAGGGGGAGGGPHSPDQPSCEPGREASSSTDPLSFASAARQPEEEHQHGQRRQPGPAPALQQAALAPGGTAAQQPRGQGAEEPEAAAAWAGRPKPDAGFAASSGSGGGGAARPSPPPARADAVAAAARGSGSSGVCRGPVAAPAARRTSPAAGKLASGAGGLPGCGDGHGPAAASSLRPDAARSYAAQHSARRSASSSVSTASMPRAVVTYVEAAREHPQGHGSGSPPPAGQAAAAGSPALEGRDGGGGGPADVDAARPAADGGRHGGRDHGTAPGRGRAREGALERLKALRASLGLRPQQQPQVER